MITPRPPYRLLMLSLCCALGCNVCEDTGPSVGQPPQDMPSMVTPDMARSDVSSGVDMPAVGDMSDADNMTLAVAITSPDRPVVRVQDMLTFQINVLAGEPDKVELVRDEQVLATLVAPYAYTWDASLVDEGSYVFVARASQGDVVVDSNAIEVVIDRSGPSVTASTPVDGDGNVAVISTITIVFDDVMDGRTVTDEAYVKLVDADNLEIGATRVLSEDGTTLTLGPDRPPRAGERWSVEVSTDVTDEAGNALREGFQATWVYPDFWDYPGLMTNNVGLGGPALALDSIGRPLLAYDICENGQLDCGERERDIVVVGWRDGAWTELGDRIDDADGDAFWAPALAIDFMDRPVVAFVDGDNVRVKRWDNGAWADLGGALNTEPGAAAAQPDVTVDTRNRPVVAWAEEDGNNGHNAYVKRWEDGAWVSIGGAVDLNLGTDIASPRVTTTIDDTISLLYHFGNTGWLVRSWIGDVWQTTGGELPRSRPWTQPPTMLPLTGALAARDNQVYLAMEGCAQLEQLLGSAFVCVRSGVYLYSDRPGGSSWSRPYSAAAANLPSNGKQSMRRGLAVAVTSAGSVIVVSQHGGVVQLSEVAGERLVRDNVQLGGGGTVALRLTKTDVPVVAFRRGNELFLTRENR